MLKIRFEFEISEVNPLYSERALMGVRKSETVEDGLGADDVVDFLKARMLEELSRKRAQVRQRLVQEKEAADVPA